MYIVFNIIVCNKKLVRKKTSTILRYMLYYYQDLKLLDYVTVKALWSSSKKIFGGSKMIIINDFLQTICNSSYVELINWDLIREKIKKEVRTKATVYRATMIISSCYNIKLFISAPFLAFRSYTICVENYLEAFDISS
jgi:hypothetical protein